MYDFNKMVPIFDNKVRVSICEKCDGRGVIPKDKKIITCPQCNGKGKNNV